MLEIFILFFLIILNGLFVMAEIALVSARKSRLEQLADKGDDKAKAALRLAENPELFLSRFGEPTQLVRRMELGGLRWLERRTFA